MKSKELDAQIIELVEIKLNQWANENSYRFKIPKNSFHITVKQHPKPKRTRYGYIVQDGSYMDYMKNENTVVRPKRTYIESPNFERNQVLAQVTNGPIVNITVFIPQSSQEGDFAENLKLTIKKMKSTIKGLFKYISDPRLHHDDELFNPLIVGTTLHEYSVTDDKFKKVWRRRKFDPFTYNGHKRNEFYIEVEKIVTVVHKETGEGHTIITKSDRPSWSLIAEALDKCSTNVNELLELKDDEVIENTTLVPVRYYQEAKQITNVIIAPYIQ